jgi:threonine dehydratase
MQVPRQDKKAFREFLSTLNYPCVDETENPAYQLFLR